MDNVDTEDHLLSEEPNLYEFEKKCDFFHSKSKQSFRLPSSESPELKRNHSNSLQSPNTLLPLSPEEKFEAKPPLTLETAEKVQKNSLQMQDSPIFEDMHEILKEDEEELDVDLEDEEEEKDFSEISSVILEEDEEEDAEESKTEPVERSKKSSNELNPLEIQNAVLNEEEIVDKLFAEDAEKDHNLSENESRDPLEYELELGLYNESAAIGANSQRIRYQEKFRHISLIIFPDDPLRNVWDIVLILVLSYTCLIMPYRIAFLSNYDDIVEWYVVDWTTDSIFYVDILVNFLSAYYDAEDDLVVSRKKIMLNYLSGWFLLDLAGVLPFDQMFDVDRYGNLVRVSRLPRLYKLLRLTRLLKMLKVIKERNKILRRLLDVLQIGAGFERVFISFLSIFLFCHISACFWYMAADLNEDPANWVRVFSFTDQSNVDCYIASFYYIVQTVVTVGYGDMHSNDTLERLLTCFLMFIGVFFYSFTIGSLSSLLTNIDSKSAHLETKLNTLLQLKSQYNLDDELYVRLKRGIKHGLSRLNFDKIEFLDNLPVNLRVELSVIMHKSLVQSIDFFQNKPARFIAFIGPYLKSIKHGKDEYIYSEGDYADEMYFIKQGNVSLVLKEYGNFEYLKIEKGYYFGEVDLLFGETRKATVMSNNDLELLSINKKHFTKVFFHEFREIGSEIYKNALKRKLRAAKIHKEAIEYCKKEALNQQSFTQRSSLLRKKKNSVFQAQISMAKDFSSSLKESEIFSSYKPFNKESFYIPRHTAEQTGKIDRHLNANAHASRIKKHGGALENKISLNSNHYFNNNINNINNNNVFMENIEQESKEKLESFVGSPQFLTKNSRKGNYYEKFTSMLANTPLIAKNYIPFDLFSEEKNQEKNEESLKKIDELQFKITQMDKNMEELIKLFQEIGENLQT